MTLQKAPATVGGRYGCTYSAPCQCEDRAILKINRLLDSFYVLADIAHCRFDWGGDGFADAVAQGGNFVFG